MAFLPPTTPSASHGATQPPYEKNFSYQIHLIMLWRPLRGPELSLGGFKVVLPLQTHASPFTRPRSDDPALQLQDHFMRFILHSLA